MNEYYSVQMDPDFLEHHGVFGMSWGKRNGPPYPLDAQGKSDLKEQREKKSLSTKVGEKRLDKRQENYKKVTSKAQYSLSERKRDSATNLHLKSEATSKARNDANMVQKIGKETIKQRTVVGLSATTTAGIIALAGAAAETAAFPVIGIPATIGTAAYIWNLTTK